MKVKLSIAASAMVVVSVSLVSAAAIEQAPGREVRVADVKALAEAVKAARPGDVILLRAGEWRDAEIRVRATGTAEAPITIRAEEPGKTVLSGKSSFRLSGQHVIVSGLAFRDFADEGHIFAFRTKEGEEASDCRLTDTSFDRPLPTDKDADVSCHWVSVYGKRNRVDHCYLEGKRTSSPMLTVWVNTDNSSDDHRIDHNHFGGRGPLGKNGGETIRVGTSQVSMHNSRTIVERNLFERCNGESEVISNKSCENIYRGNVFVESKGALVLRHGNRCLVEGNWFFGNGVEGTGGIRVIGEDHRLVNNYLSGLMGKEFESALPINDGIPDSPANGYFRVKRLVIAHNTIVDCAQSLSFGVGHGARNRIEQADDVLVANNLIVSTQGPLVRFLSTPTNLRWVGNLVWGASLGFEAGAGVVQADPSLATGAGVLRRPGAGVAPVAPIEVTGLKVTTDIEGRPRGARVVPGCFEIDGPTAGARVTRADVGPVWRKQ